MARKFGIVIVIGTRSPPLRVASYVIATRSRIK
jgi:hypothetical protein